MLSAAAIDAENAAWETSWTLGSLQPFTVRQALSVHTAPRSYGPTEARVCRKLLHQIHWNRLLANLIRQSAAQWKAVWKRQCNLLKEVEQFACAAILASKNCTALETMAVHWKSAPYQSAFPNSFNPIRLLGNFWGARLEFLITDEVRSRVN